MRSYTRQYDVALLGATGFTATLVAQVFAATLTSEIRWLIAGRNYDKLRGLLEKLRKLNPEGPVPDIQSIDVVNDNLTELARSTKVIVNAIGPYTRYGRPVVEACAANGTSYVDFSTETPWIEEMILIYHDLARENHATIIPAIGNSSSPSALIALLLADQYRILHGNDVREIVSCYGMKINGMSGGSLSSVVDVVDTYGIRHLLSPNPYRLCPSKETKLSQTPTSIPFLGHIKDPILGHLATSFTAPGNEAIVNRSQHPQQSIAQHPSFIYKEYMPATSTLQAIAIHMLTKLGILMLALRPFRTLLNRLKPASGSGPSAEITRTEKLAITAVARGEDGKELVAEYIYNGPMYYHTAILGTAAVAVLLELWRGTDRDDSGGDAGQRRDPDMSGILTPSCLGMPFVERLRAAGVKFDVLV
ncbi:hypothetical protein LTR84_000104 [Exophiala bonariae]|uniref:Saccharopine dehydrogenase NADP binding domain-containing protein n=1 Tax=Exophiala bonariae TaxID=1690606 RepID=A0AAV9NQC3_9EURO|nr:hypothetical protein LTR84_000104 [Exophiala bonariae]